MARETEDRCNKPQLYVLTGGGGQTLFHTGPCGFGFCFPFIKKPLHLKTACCVYFVIFD